MTSPLWVWVCGPYASSEGDAGRARNLQALNEAALAILAYGHVPLIGINMALPMTALAGLDAEARDIRRPLSLALMVRCDVCLRLGGPSAGADSEVNWFLERHLPVYETLEALLPHDTR
jgi:hypothetical protein